MNRLIVCYDISSSEEEEVDDASVIRELVTRLVSKASNLLASSTVGSPIKNACPSDAFFVDRVGYRNMETRKSCTSSASELESDSDDSNDADTSVGSRRASAFHDSDDSDYFFEKIVVDSKRRLKKKDFEGMRPPKTKGELSIDDLPKIEDLQISLPDHVSLEKLGEVSSIVGSLVVILSDRNTPPLDEETLLFTKDRNSFGKVFEIFGPVLRPYYAVRFNSAQDVIETDVTPGTPIFYAPRNAEYTRGVFAETLMHQRGSDASWKDNNEPPAEALEFSDDEQERQYRRQMRSRRVAASADAAENAATGEEETAVIVADGEDAEATAETVSKKRKRPARRGRGNNITASASGDRSQQQQHSSNTLNNSSDGSHFPAHHHGRHRGRRGGYCNYSNAATSSTSVNSYRPLLAWPPRNAMQMPPPSYTQSPTNNEWMWMSEGIFRTPPPRFSHRAAAAIPGVSWAPTSSAQPYFQPPPPPLAAASVSSYGSTCPPTPFYTPTTASTPFFWPQNYEQ